jgi:hypothetical protein
VRHPDHGSVYSLDQWKRLTGHTVQELGAEWKQALATKLGVELPKVDTSKTNVLTGAEKAAVGN